MSARHLTAADAILCTTPHRWPALETASLSDVTCSRCMKRLDAMARTEADAAAERQRLTQTRAACEAVGIAHLWDRANEIDDAAGHMIRDILGSVALFFSGADL